ncbi:MAG: crossover junction endodeoxyribonuclease RuvC [Candidatus Omnitrophica bacterium]|nr:crossover junction endodeoxyribonuclease RuvC [Candidatus Omnitrophota bacterium]
MVVLSVDVGIQVCGYCVCDVNKLDVNLLEEGEITLSKKQLLPQKLGCIFDKLEDKTREYNINAIIVETLYSHHRHPTTLGVLSQVRGIVALLSFQKGIGFYEYSSTRARKSFLGKGSGNSEQVKKMAENVLGKKFKSIHTADAFSLVVAFSHYQKVEKLFSFAKASGK